MAFGKCTWRVLLIPVAVVICEMQEIASSESSGDKAMSFFCLA